MLITQFFRYLMALDDVSFGKHVKLFERESDFRLNDFTLQIMLIPLVH